ncbi:MAG TPA: hypothetical protein VHT52_17915 [Stellaceae bacterium]|jgi:hypothetical protein|nr:hypothetical protein [Stellaceae bacterium]
MLARYITDTLSLLNDAGGQFFTQPQVINFINRSRRRIAYASGCLRVLPMGVRTHAKQEVYPFSDWRSLVQKSAPGVDTILAVRSLAVAIGVGGWKPTWRRIPWTDFQARFRIFNGTFYGTISEPGWYAQYGVGELGSLYLAPIPAQGNPMEVDCTCIPLNLLTDNDPEPIPQPWQDAVSYWAAVLLLIQQQRAQDAQAMAQLFNSDLPFCASVVCPQMVQTAYGAVLRSA